MAIKSKVQVFHNINGQLLLAGIKPVNTKKQLFRYRAETYHIDTGISLFRKKNIIMYGYVIGGGQLLSQENYKEIDVKENENVRKELSTMLGYELEPQTNDEAIRDIIVDKHVIRDTIGNVMRNGMFDAAMIGYVITAIMGVFAGLFFGMYLL